MGRLGLSTGWERTALIYNWMSKSFCLEMGYLESQVYDNHKSDRWLTHFARNRDNLRAKLTIRTGRRPSMLVSSVSWQIHQWIHSEFTKTKEEIRRGESSKMSWKKLPSGYLRDFPMNTSIYKGFSMAMLHNQMVTSLFTTENHWNRWITERSFFPSPFAWSRGKCKAVMPSSKSSTFAKGRSELGFLPMIYTTGLSWGSQVV